MKNGLEVFDFKEEDEVPEAAASKFLSKFKSPSPDNNPSILKYQFLECVAQASDVPSKEIGCLACVDVDVVEYDQSAIAKKDSGSLQCLDVGAMESDNRCDDITTFDSLDKVREESAAKDGNPGLDIATLSISLNHEHVLLKMNNCESKSSFIEPEARLSCLEAQSPHRSQLDFAISDSPSSSEPAADESMHESPPSSSNFAEGVFLNAHASSCDFGDSEMDGIKIAADYIVYRDNCCPGCLVTFSSNDIKINGLVACGDEEIFSFEKGIDDVIRIQLQQLQRFDTVVMKFQILSKDTIRVDDDTSERIEELEILMVEPNWSRKWEEISSLNPKYSALWRVEHDVDATMGGLPDSIQRRPYFPNFDDDFEEVVYPKGDPDAVSICKRDVDLLQPETFVNDTIIDFYIKYLKDQIPPKEKHRFHFFNSFFFRKLADLDKDPSSASDGRAAFLRVQKWTRKVDIFGKDFVFIPVNFNLHWSLLVICHPGEAAGMKDEDSEKSLRIPCILHMDSIKGTHAGLKNLVQSYLWEEWKGRHKDTSEELSSNFLNLWFVSLELPQQENSFDCGLFLLHYLELFLVDAPLNFNPFKLNGFSKFLNVEWFPPAEASLKRTLIQRLISDLLEQRSREASSGDEPESSCQEKIERQTELEFFSERYASAISSHLNLSNTEVGRGIEITLLEAASLKNSQSLHDPLVLRELLEPGVAAGSLLAECSFDQSSYYRLNGAISQIEQGDTETGEQFMYFSGETGFQQMNGAEPEGSSVPYSFRGFGANDSWNPGLAVREGNSSSETSSCTSDGSDIGIIETCPSEADTSLRLKDEADERRYPSAEDRNCSTKSRSSTMSEMPETCAIENAEHLEGAEDPDKMQRSDDSDNLNSCQENPTAPLNEGIEELKSTEDGVKQNGDLATQQESLTTPLLEGAEYEDSTGDEPAPCQETPTTLLEHSNVAENGSLKNIEMANVTRNDGGTMGGGGLTTDLSEQQAAKRLRLTLSP